MDVLLAEGFVHHRVVTATAELEAGFLKLQGSRRGGGFVTLATHLLFHGRVDVIEEHTAPIRAVWVVALGAAGGSHRIIHVLFGKSRAGGLVACETEGDYGITFEEMVRLHRGMRIVARDAALLHRIVLEFHLGEPGAHILVAVETEIITCFQEIILVRCPVGIVAFHAVSFRRHLVDAPCLLRNHRPVTLEADLARLILDQLCVGRRVRVVTSRTLSGLDRGVKKLSLQGILKIVVAVETPLPGRIGFQPKLVLRLAISCRMGKQNHRNERATDEKAEFHVLSFSPLHFPTTWHSSQDLDAKGA